MQKISKQQMNMIYNETASIGDRGRNAATFLVVELLGKRFVEEQSLRPVSTISDKQ